MSDIRDTSIRQLVVLVDKLMDELTCSDTVYYKWNVDFTKKAEHVLEEEDDKVIVEVDIERDAELTEPYETAHDIFGTLAEEVKVRFDDVERDGHKHWVEITLNGKLDLPEEEN